MTPPPSLPPRSGPGGGFAERLGTYLLGVAIGLVLVGMLWMARMSATRPPDPPRTPQQGGGQASPSPAPAAP